MTKVLFICHGNICRSPMAEMIMKNIIKEKGLTNQFEISSAAVSTEEIGNGIYPPAKQVLTKHHISFTNHISRQVTQYDYDYYDYLICMDTSNLRLLKRFIPENDPASKVSLLMEYVGQYRDVADPWYTNDFETTYKDILNGCNGLINHIENQ